MSTEPLVGHAVHAPMVKAPKATPRVSVSQVAPSPIAAASIKVKQEPRNKRTFDPIEWRRSRQDFSLCSQDTSLRSQDFSLRYKISTSSNRREELRPMAVRSLQSVCWRDARR